MDEHEVPQLGENQGHALDRYFTEGPVIFRVLFIEDEEGQEADAG